MAKGMREIKRSIKSKQNTKQITKAMEMVAASKLRRAQEAAEASRPYSEKMKEVIASIAAGTKGVKHPMLQTRPIKKTGYLVITSDRGLAGGYNANVLRKVMNVIREKHNSTNEYAIFVIGRKGRDFFSKRNIPIVEEVTGLADSPTFADVKQVAASAVANFEKGTYDELYLVYNEFKNAITQIPTVKRLLPLEEVSGASVSNYEYEPSPEGVLEVLLPKYAETLIYSAVLDGKASEFGARMTAMNSATKNATKMISTLTLQYNRARQASITQEISEIVAGANAQS
ncbi:ATP synthase F1 subunit gamma [Paenibacillus mucilaginosus]|uniref:ATP synthase gamma chain n=3 Tax=Paenibacillus mucilaginosus TaxID=61624 RepID=H6NT26_9BACL|nr:ATP synthase F1 subunit gamma [Paenibacillus mucilaginosus]AEI38704.1 AtpG [Paenibacillus mucilaginosus KNP414]AFC27039.1 AtpG [Paenibacillus mucilaginosus 3016]AFH59173.1 F0F1 ATP synthase subunit gamma [Paenibacillus mucilaginosus K02]MCG7215842.1 F0F1 ATP synthase subunit gamma [Paenibacillus mucilaginosus]WDM27791.1 F0F1 ATP synthase subunit gamma [Paenibacillus mucilaginosus]